MKSILKVALFVLIGVFCSGTLQAQVVIYDNLTADGGNTNFGGGTGFPASRRMIGDDINTLPLNDPDEFYSVDTVDFPLRFASTAEISPGVIVDFTEFTDVEVTVTFWENVVTATNADGTANGNATAATVRFCLEKRELVMTGSTLGWRAELLILFMNSEIRLIDGAVTTRQL